MAEQEWIKQIWARGWGAALSTALDVLEPLGPLGAQLLWVAQPAARLIGGSDAVGALAQALEEPGGIDRLRQRLEADEDRVATAVARGSKPLARSSSHLKVAVWQPASAGLKA